jgi:hypothetical protein
VVLIVNLEILRHCGWFISSLLCTPFMLCFAETLLVVVFFVLHAFIVGVRGRRAFRTLRRAAASALFSMLYLPVLQRFPDLPPRAFPAPPSATFYALHTPRRSKRAVLLVAADGDKRRLWRLWRMGRGWTTFLVGVARCLPASRLVMARLSPACALVCGAAHFLACLTCVALLALEYSARALPASLSACRCLARLAAAGIAGDNACLAVPSFLQPLARRRVYRSACLLWPLARSLHTHVISRFRVDGRRGRVSPDMGVRLLCFCLLYISVARIHSSNISWFIISRLDLLFKATEKDDDNAERRRRRRRFNMRASLLAA